LFVSISQVIGCEDCLQNDLDCVLVGMLNFTPDLTLFNIICNVHISTMV